MGIYFVIKDKQGPLIRASYIPNSGDIVEFKNKGKTTNYVVERIEHIFDDLLSNLSIINARVYLKKC